MPPKYLNNNKYLSKMKYSHLGIAALSSLLLEGCASPNSVNAPSAPAISKAPISEPSQPLSPVGLESVLGLTEPQLVRKFGNARLDVREANGRKLQFSGKSCIMDVYLYAQNNNAEVATHVDARRSDGAEVDRGACVKALSQR